MSVTTVIGILFGALILAVLGLILWKVHQANTKKPDDNLQEKLAVMHHDVKDIKEQKRNEKDMLNTIMGSSGKRGSVGEIGLNTLLKDALPKDKFGKHTFKDGKIVDCAVQHGSKLVPIDSKFPYANYAQYLKLEDEKEKQKAWNEFVKDVKKHIEKISQSYIKPNERTTSQAIMYIHSNAIRDAVIDDQAVQKHAHQSNVVISCPNDLLFNLHFVMDSITRERINENADRILSNIRALQSDMAIVQNTFATLQKHSKNNDLTVEKLGKNLSVLDSKVGGMAQSADDAEESDVTHSETSNSKESTAKTA